MPDSGVEERAMRLLVAFHDLAGGKLNVAVPVGGPDSEEDGAADQVGVQWQSTERDVALGYLLDQGYVKAENDGTNETGYTLTYQGLERVREYLDPPGSDERTGMTDKRQRQLVTLVSTVVALGISQPITNYIAEQIPERRGIKDDLLEAGLQGLVRAISILAASLVVRQIANRI